MSLDQEDRESYIFFLYGYYCSQTDNFKTKNHTDAILDRFILIDSALSDAKLPPVSKQEMEKCLNMNDIFWYVSKNLKANRKQVRQVSS